MNREKRVGGNQNKSASNQQLTEVPQLVLMVGSWVVVEYAVEVLRGTVSTRPGELES